MGIGLTLMTGLGSLPLLFILWFLASLVGVIVVAEALERTRGLAPTTYGGAFWLALAFVVFLVVLEIASWIPRETPGSARVGYLSALLTRPIAAVVLLLPTFLLVLWDLNGTDVPDIITTVALLCVLGYGLFVLPLALVASTVRLARWLWKLGSASGFRSGLVSGAATVLGALIPTCMFCSPPPDGDDEAEAAAIEAGIEHGTDVLRDAVEHKGLVEGTLSALTRAATVIPGSSGPWNLPPAFLPDLPRASRDDCVLRLATSIRGRATVDKAMDWLIRTRNADRDTANAVAFATIWSVCNVHARRPIDDLETYYWTSVRQNYCKNYQRNPLRECALFEDENRYCNVGFPLGGTRELDVVIDFSSKLCKLDERDRQIILRTMEGESSMAIGRALGMTDANVRQRLKRALEKIQDA